MPEVVVTRGSQITLTKEVRERLSVKEGDIILLNVMGNVLIASKRNPNIWKEVGDFLPENFEKVLKKIRSNPRERLKRFGIVE